MRTKQKAPTKGIEHIPHDHKCNVCHKGLDETNFRVNEVRGSFYPESRCNICRGLKLRVKETIRPPKWKRIKIISNRVKEYFNANK